MSQVLFVGLGGFLGANARYFISAWVVARVTTLFGLSIAFGTMLVNILGSFGLAVFSVWVSQRLNIPENVRLFIATGFFGAFTTFSTYANESIALFRFGAWFQGIAYIVLTNGLCLLGVILGLWVAKGVFNA